MDCLFNPIVRSFIPRTYWLVESFQSVFAYQGNPGHTRTEQGRESWIWGIRSAGEEFLFFSFNNAPRVGQKGCWDSCYRIGGSIIPCSQAGDSSKTTYLSTCFQLCSRVDLSNPCLVISLNESLRAVIRNTQTKSARLSLKVATFDTLSLWCKRS